MRIGNGSDVKTGLEKSVHLLWVAGNCLWFPIVFILWWHGYDVQNFAGAPVNPHWLLSLFTPGSSHSVAQARQLIFLVCGMGICWSLTGQAWLAKLRKTRKI
jgi:hypothetical protein